jgi:hypothetical protein
MGQEKMNLPNSPIKWAVNLSKLVKLFHEIHGLDRFPIKVADIARDYSAQVYPQSAITLVEGQALSNGFEGALVPKPDGSGEWAILYNSAIASSGRINFTLGHELGHYLLHRHLSGEAIYCAKNAMREWDSKYAQMEAQANEFASSLLMPLDDFREQTKGFTRPNIQDFEVLRRRYDVSLTAAILKWLSFSTARAMIVVSRDGFIDWSRSSDRLLKSGVYFKAKQNTTELPSQSLAALQDTSMQALAGKMLPAGIWPNQEEVFESVMHSEHHGTSLSLLIYPHEAPNRWIRLEENEESEVEDSYDRIQRMSR